MSTEKATHVFIGRSRCGCAVAVCVDDKHAAKDVKEMLERGYAVTRMTYDEYHTTVRLGHVCPDRRLRPAAVEDKEWAARQRNNPERNRTCPQPQ